MTITSGPVKIMAITGTILNRMHTHTHTQTHNTHISCYVFRNFVKHCSNRTQKNVFIETKMQLLTVSRKLDVNGNINNHYS